MSKMLRKLIELDKNRNSRRFHSEKSKTHAPRKEIIVLKKWLSREQEIVLTNVGRALDINGVLASRNFDAILKEAQKNTHVAWVNSFRTFNHAMVKALRNELKHERKPSRK